MRWKVKKKDWKEGATRWKIGFAFPLPIQIRGQMVWFERYWIKQELKSVAVFDEGTCVSELQWVEIDRDTLDYYG